jgi:hypothetical protein
MVLDIGATFADKLHGGGEKPEHEEAARTAPVKTEGEAHGESAPVTTAAVSRPAASSPDDEEHASAGDHADHDHQH